MHPDSRLDRQLALLRRSVAEAAPPATTDAAIARAIAAAKGRPRRASSRSWIAWPIALAASIAMIAFAIRQLPPQAGDADARDSAASNAARAKFMPLVPVAEIERAGDALLVPARVPRSTIAEFGLPIDPARAGDPVDAELLLRRDGALLAVRFLD